MENVDYLTPEVTGTIHVVVRTEEGVVMAADSRSSAGSTATNPYSNKLWQVGPRVFFGRCGTTSHTQMITRMTRYALNVLNANTESGNKRDVRTAAEFASQFVQNNKQYLSGILMVGGYDEEEGPQVYEVTQTGFLVKRNLAVTGSGSAYVTALIDATYREDFTLEQATEFAIRAVSHAIVRDGSCGGVVSVVQIMKDKVVRKTVRSKDMPVNDSIIKS